MMNNDLKQMFLFLVIGFCAAFAYYVTGLFFENPLDLMLEGEKAPLILFIVVLLVELVGLFYLSFKLKNFGSHAPNSYGTAMLLNPKQAKTQKKDVFGNDGVILSKNLRLTGKKSFEHICLIGPTGSGKSASTFIPNLLDLDQNSSAVVTDPKGELAEKTAARLIQRGFQILILAPERKQTMSWNLLANCKDEEEVIQLADLIMANGGAAMEQLTGTKQGGAEWLSMGSNLFKASLLYEYRNGLRTVSEAVRNLNKKPMEELESMFESDDYALEYWNIFKQSATSENTAASIRSTVSNNTAIFLSKNVQKLTNHKQLSSELLRSKPTVLFIQYPEEKSALYAPVFAPIFSQMLSHIKAQNGCPVYFFLDEFANIGRIGGIDNLAATIRSRKMSLLLGIQSIKQLEKNYGRNDAIALMENLKTKIFLPGISGDTAKYASDLAGQTEMKTLSTSYGKNSNTSYSHSTTKRELFSADEIRRMKDETCLLIIENMNPIYDQQMRYYKDKNLIAYSNLHFDNDEYLKKKADTTFELE